MSGARLSNQQDEQPCYLTDEERRERHYALKPGQLYYYKSEAYYQDGALICPVYSQFPSGTIDPIVLKPRSDHSTFNKIVGGIAFVSGFLMCAASYAASIYPFSWPFNLLGAEGGKMLMAFGIASMGVGVVKEGYDQVRKVATSPVQKTKSVSSAPSVRQPSSSTSYVMSRSERRCSLSRSQQSGTSMSASVESKYLFDSESKDCLPGSQHRDSSKSSPVSLTSSSCTPSSEIRGFGVGMKCRPLDPKTLETLPRYYAKRIK